MKIGIYDPYLDTLGGGERYILSIAEYLSKDNEVYIFWDGDKVLKQAEQKFGFKFDNIQTTKNIFSPDIKLLKKLWESRKYDLIIYLSDGSIPLLLSKKLFIHFQFPVEWVTYNLMTKLKMFRIKGIICNSFYTKQFIERKFRKECYILYPPVDAKKFLHPNSAKDKLILTVGRLGKLPTGGDFKKFDLMIELFKRIINKGLTTWKFAVVISYLPKDKNYVDQLERLSVGYPIKIYRNISSKEIINIYNKAKIYWHAAGFGEDLNKYPERAEHFGISTAEAMAAKCIPIVFDAGGQTEIVTDNQSGFLWKTGDELIDKTSKLIQDEKLMQETSKNAQIKAQEFSQDRFYEKLKKVIFG